MAEQKRVSDPQISEDSDDAGTEDRCVETPGPGRAVARARQHAMQQRIWELNEHLLREVVRHWDQQQHAADYSHVFQEYLEQTETIERENEEGAEGRENRVTKAATPGTTLSSLSLDASNSSGTVRWGFSGVLASAI